jgi:release factor glutamine methyltransferase
MPRAETAVLGRHDAGDALTVAGLRQTLAGELRAAGIESAALDARLLLGHALALDQASLAAYGACRLDAGQRAAIAALARRRVAREPVARIVGSKEFWSLSLAVDSSTLVPRPETETVVEETLAAVDADGRRAQSLRIADLGTGSGALLLALMSELPDAFGVGTDASVRAIKVARNNAQRLRLARATFVACDMASALGGPFDIVVSNPPYVASDHIASLPPEVRDFDPRAALDGGPDGINYYRSIAASVPPLLARGGILVVEVGAGQADAVKCLLSAAGLTSFPPRTDLNGIPRALLAIKG